MKRTIITLTVVLAALVLAILLGTPKAQYFNSSAAIAAPAPAPMAVPMPNRCPNIHEAIRALRSAERDCARPATIFAAVNARPCGQCMRQSSSCGCAENCDRCR